MTRKLRFAASAIGGACLTAASVLMLAGCNRSAGQSRATTQDSPAAAVRVETIAVSREHLQRVSEAMPAELMPYEKTDLYAKVSGFFKEIRVDYGDRVEKGGVLAVLHVPEMEKELDQKKAMLTRAEKAIR